MAWKSDVMCMKRRKNEERKEGITLTADGLPDNCTLTDLLTEQCTRYRQTWSAPDDQLAHAHDQ